MDAKDMYRYLIPALFLLAVAAVYFIVHEQKRQRIDKRIARVTKRKTIRVKDVLSLRKASGSGLPFVNKILESVTNLSPLRARLERAGLKINPDIYVTACGGASLFILLVVVVLHKPLFLGILLSLLFAVAAPYFYVGFKGNKRIKKFLTLFPDAIDFIVRGLRSGLPVTESMNMVGTEMEEPIGGIFSGIGESIRLGVPVEKALSDTARKLSSTEFNFFVTSIILQRETGGNLSEILSNLSEVLRSRFMMRMKIKAMSSEAKASAIIVGSLPFVVTLALSFISPAYLEPLIDDPRGHIAVGIAATSLSLGIGIMIKMTRFEI